MYKIIIIEDDIPVLRQLNNIISQIKSDFEIVKTFTHPLDAIEYINENPVDAVITDIQLPSMTGIEFLEYCRQKQPNAKFAILSAYDNFEYAQKAIDLEVVHYVLKPITISKLEIMLEKLSQKLYNSISREGFATSSLTTNRQQTILNLISGFYSNYSLFFNDMQKNDVSLDEKNCQVACLSIKLHNFHKILKEKSTHSKEELYRIITNIVDKNNIHIYSVLFNYADDNFTIFIFNKMSQTIDSFKHIVSQYVHDISSDIKIILSMESELISNTTFQNIDEFYKNQRRNSSFEDQAENIMSYVYESDFDAAIRCIETVKMIFDNSQVQTIYNCILSHLFNLTGKTHVKINNSSEKLYNIIISEINIIKRNNLVNNSKPDIIEKACKFINDNFANDITLNDVANHVFLSPIYFSSYFKKKTGEKYSDYLQNVKLKKAKELLKDTDVKIPTISEMSGFRDANYFHKIFKNQVGITPSEYRKIYRGES